MINFRQRFAQRAAPVVAAALSAQVEASERVRRLEVELEQARQDFQAGEEQLKELAEMAVAKDMQLPFLIQRAPNRTEQQSAQRQTDLIAKWCNESGLAISVGSSVLQGQTLWLVLQKE